MSVMDYDWVGELSACFCISFCLDNMQRDPYESKMVEINTSGIAGASEGLFAKRTLEMNTTAAFYNGALVSHDDDQESSETNNYKIFDPADIPDGTIDIPIWAQVGQVFICINIMKYFHISVHR